jgi:acyl carrier protein
MITDEQRSAIIGYWRSGAWLTEISNITGFNLEEIEEIIINYKKQNMEITKTKTEVFEKLKLIISKTTGNDEVEAENSLVDDLDLDSLDIVYLTMECEKEFHISIYDDEAEKATTVQQLLDLIYSKL